MKNGTSEKQGQIRSEQGPLCEDHGMVGRGRSDICNACAPARCSFPEH